MGAIIDISGLKVGRLTVVGIHSLGAGGRPIWNCMCECGNSTVVRGVMLRSGRTKSCGCFKKERMHEGIGKTHGMAKTKTYSSWASMVARCNNKANPAYTKYGAVGITVCERWLRFENFLSDMGIRPDGKTIDRINGSLGYSPENCRWATCQEQSNNTRTNRKIEYAGKIVTAREISNMTGLPYEKLRHHICRNGESPETVVSKMIGATA